MCRRLVMDVSLSLDFLRSARVLVSWAQVATRKRTHWLTNDRFTVLSKLTGTESTAADYAFTTLTAIPGGESRLLGCEGAEADLSCN